MKRDSRKDSFVDNADVGVNPQSNFTFSGWDIQTTDFCYDPAGDKLIIDIDFFVIAGDADGNGDPGAMQSQLAGTDSPNLGTGEAISVYIDRDSDGLEDVVIGVSPGGQLDPNTLELEIATPLTNSQDYGAAITTGATAYAGWNPSSQPGQEDFQIIVHGWSLLDDTDPNLFGLRVFAGSFVDAGFGEDNIPDSSNDPPLIADLELPLIGEQIMRDENGNIYISWRGAEERPYESYEVPNLNGRGEALVLTGDEELEGTAVNNGIFHTNFIGDSMVNILQQPTLPRRAFYQVREPES